MNLILQAIKSMFRGVYNAIEASRTHWDTRKTEIIRLTFNGNMDGKEIMQMDEYDTLVKISEEVPTIEEVIGASISYYNIDGDFSEVVTDDSVFELVSDAFVIDGNQSVLLVLADVVGEDAPPLTKGVWVVHKIDESGVPMLYPTSIKYTKTTGELKQLDKKYLPDSVQSDIETAKTMAETALGKILYVTYEYKDESRVTNVTHLQILEHMRAGGIVFLVDTSGNIAQCLLCTSADTSCAHFETIHYIGSDVYFKDYRVIENYLYTNYGEKLSTIEVS